jgi:copper(I)-binding protein
MKKIINQIFALTILLMFSSAFAADNVMVHNAWVRSAPPNAKVLAAYMKIINKSDEQRVLKAVSSSLFGKVQMHKTEMQDGMMKMVHQKQLHIPAGGSLTLEPGGYHLMLMNPKSVPQVGEQVDLELKFDNGLNLNVNAPVREAKGGDMMGGHH